jgi:DNA-directed RNA polymerase II subunit RPB1
VDATRTYSNDVLEMQRVFGIEKGRQMLLEEFKIALGGEKVDYHHLSVLVDAMCLDGVIYPVGRHGMNRSDDIGPLARATFEMSDKVVEAAAVGAELDTLTGVSANIMLGQLPPIGTGEVTVFVNESEMPEVGDGAQEGEQPKEEEEADLLLRPDCVVDFINAGFENVAPVDLV